MQAQIGLPEAQDILSLIDEWKPNVIYPQYTIVRVKEATQQSEFSWKPFVRVLSCCFNKDKEPKRVGNYVFDESELKVVKTL